MRACAFQEKRRARRAPPPKPRVVLLHKGSGRTQQVVCRSLRFLRSLSSSVGYHEVSHQSPAGGSKSSVWVCACVLRRCVRINKQTNKTANNAGGLLGALLAGCRCARTSPSHVLTRPALVNAAPMISSADLRDGDCSTRLRRPARRMKLRPKGVVRACVCLQKKASGGASTTKNKTKQNKERASGVPQGLACWHQAEAAPW